MIGNKNIFKVSHRTWILLAFLALSMIVAGPAYAALSCSACHTMPPLDSAAGDRQPATGAFKGNHQGHSSNSITSCIPCHGAAVSSYSPAHRGTGLKSVIKLTQALNNYSIGHTLASYSRGTFFNQTSVPPNPLGTCSSVNCHFESATPAWGTTNFASPTDCDKCHGAPPSAIDPGSHAKHNTYYPGVTNCQKCHPNNTTFQHATSAGNRPLAISFAAAPNNGSGAYSGPLNDYLPSQTNDFGNCTATYCHSNGSRGFAPYTTNTAATWGGSLTCKGCHKADLASGSDIQSGSHRAHVNGFGSAYNTIKCVKCHAVTATSGMTIATPANHVDKQVQVAFHNSSSAANGSYNTQTATPATPSVKAAGTGYGQCQNVYCHSTGQGVNGTWPPVYQSPNWGTPANGKCGTCHGVDSNQHSGQATANVIASGSHTKHLRYTFGMTNLEAQCAACHSTAAGLTQTGCQSAVCHTNMAQKHANYEVNVGIPALFGASAGYSGTTKPGDGYGTCSSVYCHSNGLATSPTYVPATWGDAASGACGTCHGVTAAAPPASSPHVKHMGSGNPYRIKCAACHSGKVQVTADSTIAPTYTNLTSHVNKTRDVKFDAMNPNGTYTAATQTCASAYCHSIGKTGGTVPGTPASSAYGAYSASFPYSKMKWSGTTNCRSCHGRTSLVPGAPDYASAAAGAQYANSHQKHVQSSTNCQYCHQKTTVNGTSILATSTDHVDGNIDVRFKRVSVFTTFSGSFTSGGKSCSATYCHGSGTPVWGNNGAYKCNDCHSALSSDTDWATTNPNAHLIHLSAVMPARFQSMSGNVSTTTAYRFSCSACHDPNRALHAVGPQTANRAAEVFFAFTTASHGSITYAEGGTVKADKLSYNWTNGGAGTTANSCSATYCHSNGQVAGFANGADVNWGTSASTAGAARCKQCHNYTTASGAAIATGDHTAHVNGTTYNFSCRKCHAATTTDGSTITDKSKHVNKLVNVAFNNSTTAVGGTYNSIASPMSKVPGPPYASCANTYCHSQGTSATSPSAPNITATWDSSLDATCTGCHYGDNSAANKMGSGGVGTVAHAKHVQTYTYGCVKCHETTVSANRTISNYASHVNRQVNIEFNNTTTAVSGTYNGSASPMTKLPGTATGTCTNTYCHSKGTSLTPSAAVPNIVPNWTNNLNATCSSCHGGDNSATSKMGTVGSVAHTKHIQTYTYGCVKCHETTVSANRTISNYASHVNRQVNIEFNNTTTAVSGTYNGSVSPMTKLPGTATGTCTNTYCHSKGTSLTPSAATPNIVPNWTNNLDATCTSCHGGDNSATSKMGTVGSVAHIKHVQTYSFSCVKCHETTVSANRTISNTASHVNRQVNIEFNNSTTAVSGTYNGSASPMTKLPGTATGTCTNTYCHSKGTSTTPSAATPNIVPNWTTNLDATCTSCHGGDNSATNKMGTVGSATHTKHVQTYAYDCSYCHAATVTNSRTIGTIANHVNRMVDVQFSAWPNSTATYIGTTPKSKLPGSAVGACGNTYCHSNGTSVSSGTIPAHTSVNWGTAGPLACNSCHGTESGTSGGAPRYSHLMRLPTAQAGATWTTPANALTENRTFATYAGTAAGTLILTNFGYTAAQVADSDTITGITVIVRGWAAAAAASAQLNVQLTKDGIAAVVGSTAKTITLPSTTAAANADVYATTTVTDLWGASWSPTEIRATTFGVILKDNDLLNSALNVDAVKVIVHTIRSPKMTNHSSAYGHRVVTCNICHDSVTYSAGVYTPNVTLHVNKAYNVQASLGYTYAANGGSCATPGNGCHGPTAGKWGGMLGCVDCHNKVITRTKGRPGATLANVVGEFGLAWGHKKSGRAAVTDDDCIVCHLEGDGTSHKASAKHQDGNIDLRDPDGIVDETPITNISGGAFTFQRFSTSYAATTRYTNGQTLNNIDNVITQKFCLACHDSNGANNTKARSNNGGAGTATRPFGGIDMGANYSVVNGAAAANSMVDVKTQLATTNSSKHPVLGPLNRDFPTAARMSDPYKPTGTRGTSGTLSNGVVINCFDCHNVVGTPLTLRTVTAHGNAVTIRGTATVSGAPGAGNDVTFCKVCHAGYVTGNSGHAAGSAFSSDPNKTTMTTYVNYGCNICHGSSYTTAAVRPVRAMDSHGVNVLPSGGVAKSGRWAGGSYGAPAQVNARPYAFIRNTEVLSEHVPKKIGTTVYSSGTAAGNIGCNMAGGSCVQGKEGYTAGGTF